MFYAHFVLAKKGPLARIWLAAHWDKKLTKAHVFETNIETSVEGILQPKVKMALRTSGHLLLGIVRIYSRKAKYLLADCNEAFIKIKMAFRPGAVDLPEENRQAHVNAITLPEVFHDFETGMPDLNNIDMEAAVTLNQSRAEDITLKEDYGPLSLMNDDGFGDMGFDDPEMAREATNIDEAFDQASLLLGAGTSSASVAGLSVVDSSAGPDVPHEGHDAPLSNSLEGHPRDEAFGAAGEDGLLGSGTATGSMFEPAGLFADAPLGPVPLDTSGGSDRAPEEAAPRPAPVAGDESDDDDDMYDMGPPSMGGPSSPDSSVAGNDLEGRPGPNVPGDGVVAPHADFMGPPIVPVQPQQAGADEGRPPGAPAAAAAPGADQTTLLHDEDESFALAPLDATLVQGVERAKAKRKRKLIVDEVKNISGEEMKSQLSDTTDIVTTLDLAPPTKRLMHWKETGGVEKLFALPGRPILSRNLSKLYQRHLTTKAVENEDFGGEEDDPLEEDPEQVRAVTEDEVGQQSKRRRIEDDLVGEQGPSQYELGPSSVGGPHGYPPAPDGYHPVAPEYPVEGATGWGQEYGYPASVPPPPPPPPQQQQQGLPIDPYGAPSPFHMAPPGTPAPHGIMMGHIVPQPMQEQQSSLFSHMEPEPLPDYGPPHTPMQVVSTARIMQHPSAPSMLQQQPLVSQMLQAQSNTPTLQPLPVPALLSSTPAVQPPPTPVVQPAPAVPALQSPPSPVQQPQNEFDALVASGPSMPDMAHYEPLAVEEQGAGQQPLPQNHQDEDDDYAAPASVGPVEEQQADETYEQFEERVLTKRTVHMLHLIRNTLENGRRVRFSDVARNSLRKQVAQKFYTFLVLKKQQAVELSQEAPYAELYIEKGPRYEQSL